jgi:tetratricopeptide (TPR) repeat protein
LPRVPSWRWMVAGEVSPWYSSVKLFRQPRRRQWAPVLEQVAAKLRTVVTGASGLSAAERMARIRAVQPQNEPPEVAPLEPSSTADHHWLDARELGSRHPLQVIATLQEQAETAFRANDFVEAERLYREILLITPRHLKAHAALGSIARETGRLDHAVRCFQRALSMFEPHAANHAALADTLADLGRSEEAIAHAKRALALDARLPESQRAMGRAWQLSGQHTAAAAALATAMKLLPGDVTTRCTLSRTLIASGQLDRALEMLHEQISLTPNEPRFHLALAEALLEDQAIDEAETSIHRAIELQPALATAQLLLSRLHQQRGRLPEAIAAARLAVEHRPQAVETMLHLATLLRQCDQPAEAEALYRRALALRPESVEILNSLGSALVELGRIRDAIRQCEQAITLRPNYAAAHSNRGLALLELGRFAEGWDEYEWRWQSGQQSRGIGKFSQPEWDGTALTGRTILIYGEQGLGDEIMFATCYPDVIEQAARAIILCDARLERLFRRSFPQATVLGIPQGSEYSWRLPQNIAIDVQCAAGSLPRFLRGNADKFPRQNLLLQPADEKVAVWRGKLSQLGAGTKVGIAWCTGDAAGMPSRRGTQLETWRPILTAKNVQCVNLQSGGDQRREIAEVALQTGVKVFDPPEAGNQFDLDGLAAKIAALDLVITVDSPIAHLAAAVGTPTWVLLSEPASWRWLAGGEENVWYGNVRLFRAGKLQPWQEVFQRLRGELLKTTFPVDEESSRALPTPPHWSRPGIRATT